MYWGHWIHVMIFHIFTWPLPPKESSLQFCLSVHLSNITFSFSEYCFPYPSPNIVFLFLPRSSSPQLTKYFSFQIFFFSKYFPPFSSPLQAKYFPSFLSLFFSPPPNIFLLKTFSSFSFFLARSLVWPGLPAFFKGSFLLLKSFITWLCWIEQNSNHIVEHWKMLSKRHQTPHVHFAP